MTAPDARTLMKLDLLVPIEYAEHEGAWLAYVDIMGSKRIVGRGSKQTVARVDALKQLRRWINDNLFR